MEKCQRTYFYKHNASAESIILNGGFAVGVMMASLRERERTQKAPDASRADMLLNKFSNFPKVVD